MNTVKVNASRSYDIKIGPGLLSTLGLEVALMDRVRQVCIVSDSNVWPLYGKAARESLEHYGLHVTSFVFPAGESSKNSDTFLELLNVLARNHMTRSDVVVALGGGVVGDLAGFVASCYLRGIPYVQVPTTLLAAVDSSVGGKTAIDLPAGKNLAGSFYQPSVVLCDTDTLKTLPTAIIRYGCAEVIKYGVLYDRELIAHLEERGLDFDREYVITRCVQWKRDVVEKDEFDTGGRKMLNLGHTIGHGVEAASNYTVPHGQAVAIGMSIACRACCCRDTERILALLKAFGLPTGTLFSAEVLYGYSLADKKRMGSTIDLILPLAIEDCAIRPYPIKHLQSFIQAGL